ncbi:hypothetical protein [Fischerella sp.]|nr:hypothetical protein [Fischerella sp.]
MSKPSAAAFSLSTIGVSVTDSLMIGDRYRLSSVISKSDRAVAMF